MILMASPVLKDKHPPELQFVTGRELRYFFLQLRSMMPTI
jgi:hypothetical protein